jgi:hypothetical protein
VRRRLLVPAACLAAFLGAAAADLASASDAGARRAEQAPLTVPTLPLTVPALPIATTTSVTTTSYPPPQTIPPGNAARPFSGRGMWVWVMASSAGGSLDTMISMARRYGISTVMIKSADGSSTWSQFNPSVVAALHAARVRVCAWQFVYGVHPIFEAEAAAQAVRDGADCLIIDAESQYQGKYVQAQRYMMELRRLVGLHFPLALAGLPYIDYHPGFPYSVFLGPWGAQYDMPQMYWRDIGTTTDRVYAHTYEFNVIYRRPIAPLGQVYGNPPLHQIRRFRALSRVYGARGVSWWDWQSATLADFGATAQPVGSLRGYVPYTTPASVGLHALGDLVVWAQEHLYGAGEHIGIDGDFGPQTLAAVEAFQSSHALPVTGVVDAPTWTALLRYRPPRIRWVSGHHGQSATITRGGVRLLPVPRSASAPARANELGGSPGAGRPRR